MKISRVFASFIAVGLLASCATQTKEQLAAVRASGVSAALVHKLGHWGTLSPEDLIELKRHHVNDAIALRQLDRVGVDYVVDKSILKQLRTAGVSQTVIAAVVLAGRRFEEQFQHYPGAWHGAWGYSYDPFFYDLGWPYPRHPYPPGPIPYAPGPGPVAPGPRALGAPGGPGPGPGIGPRGPRP